MSDVDDGDAEDLEALVRRRLAQRVGDEVAYGIGVGEPFVMAGVDSLDLMYVVAQLEQDAQVLPATNADLSAVANSIAALVTYLAGEDPAVAGGEAR